MALSRIWILDAEDPYKGLVWTCLGAHDKQELHEIGAQSRTGGTAW